MSPAGRKPGSLKAVCFDLDGTLVDSGPLHVEAERLALVALGVPELAPDHPVTFGTGVMPGLVTLANHYGFSSVEQVQAAYLKAWETNFPSGLKQMPGADKTLRMLKNSGIPLALVTSGENEYVDEVLDMFDWADLFSHRVTLESVTNLKPDPEPYLTASKLLELEPGECVGIEDSHSGLNALTTAGFYSVFVNRDQELVQSAVGADLHIESLEDFDSELVARLFGL